MEFSNLGGQGSMDNWWVQMQADNARRQDLIREADQYRLSRMCQGDGCSLVGLIFRKLFKAEKLEKS